MASRKFSTLQCSFEQKLVVLNVRAVVSGTLGSGGTITLQALNRSANPPVWQAAGANGYNGIKSVTYSSAGTFVITLQDRYVALLAFWGTFQNSAAPAAPVVLPNSGAGTNVNGATPQITFNTYSSGGVLTNPASGETLIADIELTDSMAP